VDRDSRESVDGGVGDGFGHEFEAIAQRFRDHEERIRHLEGRRTTRAS
jgi:hypothetical protein